MSRNPQTHAITDRGSRFLKAQKIEGILSLYKEIRNARILDIGAGSGYISEYFARLTGPNGRVASIDTVNQTAHDVAIDVQATTGTLIPYTNDTYDIAISNHVIEHVGGPDDQSSHLHEIHRILKTDGVLYLAVPNRWALLEPHYKLLFLSWLPKPAADIYVSLFKKAREYDCTPLSRSDIKKIASRHFDIEDMTRKGLRLFIEAELDGLKGRAAEFISSRFYFLCRPFIPTLIFVCRPKTPDLPTPA